MMETQERINELLEFNPNETRTQIWGSYVPSRRGPAFKIFTRHVDAVNSALQSIGRSGAVYFYSGGDWHLYEVWVNGKEMYR